MKSNQKQLSDALKLPDRTREKLIRIQRQIWKIKLIEAVGAAFCGLLVSFLTVFTLDRFFDTPAWLRLLILVGGSLGFMVWVPWMCHRWIWNNRHLTNVARLLRQKYPKLGDKLLGVLELVQAAGSHHSRALCEAALRQTDQEVANVELLDAVPVPRHLHWISMATGVLLIAVASFLLVPDASLNAFSRWLMPWNATERYTFAQLENLPESLVVPLAEETNLPGSLNKDSRWKPDSVTAVINGHQIQASIDSRDRFEVPLPPLSDTASVDIRVGDARQQVEIIPMARPEMTQMMAGIRLPEYLQRDDLVKQEFRSGKIKVVRGSTVDFQLTASRPLAWATVNDQPKTPSGKLLSITGVSADDTRQLDIRWRDEHRLSSRTPLKLTVIPGDDQSPRLVCRDLPIRSTIGPDDVLKFAVDASDDFGIKNIGLEWVGVPSQTTDAKAEPARHEKVVFAGHPRQEKVADAKVTFSPALESIAQQVIALRLFVEDYLPGRPRVYSQVYHLHVLSEEEQAIEIVQRLENWMQDTQETFDREQWLYSQNVELSQKSAEELNQPETRRGIEQQAAAEAQQQRQLASLTKDGEKLIRDAMNNDQFGADHIETLARMMEKLKAIQKNQMRSVASLLKEASKEAAKAQQQSPSGQSPQAGKPPESQSQSKEKGAAGKPSDQKKESVPKVVDDQSNEKRDGKKDQSPSGVSDDKDKPKDDPSVKLKESNMDESRKDEQGKKSSASAGAPLKLKLPSVILNDPEPKSGSCPARPKLKEAVEEQADLLAEFQAISEELQKLISNLEGSTFVKRLKALSRRELELVKDMAESTLVAFGESQPLVDESTQRRSELLAKRQQEHVKNLGYIMDDLSAYAKRATDKKFKDVLAQMEKHESHKQAGLVSNTIRNNDPGVSIAHAELLADLFDRWAEELVGPG